MTAGTTARPTRVSRLVAGTVLVLLALAVGSVGWSGAAAQEGEAEPVAIEESTLYVSPATDAVPPTLTRQVPPEAICVVLNDLGVCHERTEEARDTVRGGLATALDGSQDLPAQPVPPDHAAVSYFGGSPRYQTAVKFEPPAVPEGEEPISAVLTIEQADPSYDLNSPLYRGIFLAIFASISPPNPERFFDELTRELQESDPVDLSGVMGIEACPLLAEFEPGGAPEASQVDEMPSREQDGQQVADVDCILGSSGSYDESTNTWSFDLAFALSQWDSGDLDNHGILLRPTGGPNLAFGDPDTSTNAQLVLALESATLEMTTMEAFDPSDFDTGTGGGFDAPAGDDFGDAGGADGIPLDAGAPADLGGDVPMDDPAVAEGEDLEAAPEAPEEPAVALDAGADRPGPYTPWWVWSVVPLLLGGAWLTGSALLAPTPAAAASGGGALTRMIARNAAGAPTAL